MAAIVGGSLIFGFVFLLSTPGVLLQPWALVHDLKKQYSHYGFEGHWGHTGQPGLGHIWAMASYLGGALFSPNPIASVFLALASVPGVYAIWRDRRSLAVVLLLFPLSYIAYFATQRVMFARNILVLAPFLATFSARGLAEVWRWWPNWLARICLGLTIAAALGANAYWLVYAAGTIADRGSNRFLSELNGYIRSHPGQRFVGTPPVIAELLSVGLKIPSNLSPTPNADSDYVIVYASEAMEPTNWPANMFNLVVKTFGPQEVNFNYYPDWLGDDRILLLTNAKACSAGVVFVKETCPVGQWNSILSSRPTPLPTP